MSQRSWRGGHRAGRRASVAERGIDVDRGGDPEGADAAPYYSVFDYPAFGYDRGTVTLMGYARLQFVMSAIGVIVFTGPPYDAQRVRYSDGIRVPARSSSSD